MSDLEVGKVAAVLAFLAVNSEVHVIGITHINNLEIWIYRMNPVSMIMSHE